MSLKIPLVVAAFFSYLDTIKKKKKKACLKPQAGRSSVYTLFIISLGNQEEVVDQLIMLLVACHLATVFHCRDTRDTTISN